MAKPDITQSPWGDLTPQIEGLIGPGSGTVDHDQAVLAFSRKVGRAREAGIFTAGECAAIFACVILAQRFWSEVEGHINDSVALALADVEAEGVDGPKI